jgi:hypothetical protein
MIRNIWTVLCRDIITDQESNSVSYMRCIEEGSASRLPVQIGPVYLGTLWEKQGTNPDTVQFRVVLVSPAQNSQAILQTKPMSLDRPRHRLHFRLNSLELAEYGTYTILLECYASEKWLQVARLPVLIRQIDTQSSAE